METYRLKNIAIIILLLLNACLLLMVGYQEFQSLQTERRAEDQLRELYLTSQLSLGEKFDLSQQPLAALLLSRQAETEQSIAAALLGGDAVSTSQGGGIYSYEAEHGTIQFRAGGSFYGSRLDVPVEDPEEFSKDFCGRFGYEAPQFQLTENGGSAYAGQLLGGIQVANCAVELYFEQGRLVSVAGAHVTLEGATVEPGEQMSCITALVKFLDYRNTSGVVCSEVSDVRCVYQLQNASALRLAPVWRIEADTYTYFVDCESGDVYGH